MKKSNLCILIVMIILPILVTACSRSRTPRFYLLTSPEIKKETQIAAESSETAFIRFENVRIAEYLKRPQIGIRVSENEIIYDEFQRWAQPLDYNIAYIIQQNLKPKMSPNIVLLTENTTGKDVDFTIEILIRHMDIHKDNGVSIIVETSIFKERQSLPEITRSDSYKSQSPQESMEKYVMEISRLFENYCIDLANQIADL